jgi:adenosylmethionine-8-amino-7-oxononanoate aminotransferase
MKLTNKTDRDSHQKLNLMLARNLNHNWHPCSQMKDHAEFPPLFINNAKGAYLELEDGRKIIDAISSWWCKSLGHGHPRIKQAIHEQLERFEHVMFGNTTHENIILLSERLSQLTSNYLNKVLYASDGSCAVEIALKIALHARQILGQSHKNKFMCLENAYHGETALAMSVSDLGIYREPYEAILIESPVLKGIPYVSGKSDPLWSNCSEYWPAIESQLNQHEKNLTAIILEPIIQGAAGMKIYSQDFLRRLRVWTTQHDIYLIADEIMTGIGRTGLNLACDHAEITPDFLCLGKALTAGFLPLSAVLTSEKIYSLFYDDYENGKSFLHSHTHTGNALAVSAALAMFEVMDQEKIVEHVQNMESDLICSMQSVMESTGALKNLRGLGGVVAADLINSKNIKRAGYEFSKAAIQEGALMRAIGDSIYWLLPLNTDEAVLQDLKKITERAISMASGVIAF